MKCLIPTKPAAKVLKKPAAKVQTSAQTAQDTAASEVISDDTTPLQMVTGSNKKKQKTERARAEAFLNTEPCFSL